MFAMILFTSCNTPPKQEVAKQPNVIIINVDDLGYGDLSCYGATHVNTPNIDKLAEQGRRFTDAHSASAVCTPSRYSLLTGEYPCRKKGLTSPVFLKEPLVVDTEKVTIADVFQKAGYKTACIGKWHLGFGNVKPVDWNKPLKPGPQELGFDYYFGVPVVNSHPPFVFVENDHVLGYEAHDPFVYGEKANTMKYREKMGLNHIGGAQKAHAIYQDEKVGTVLKDKAISWIKEHKVEPFFLYYATTNIHHPFTPDPKFKGTSKCGMYGDFIHELDWLVGEVMNTLDEQGLSDNTMVIFTSDNGGMLNKGGQEAWMAGHHQNGDLLGFKFDAWEGGHRIPFIVRWPGKVKANSVSNSLISNVDLLATMADVVNVDLTKKDAIDSYNILQTFTGEENEKVREELVIMPFRSTHISLRKGDWMYISDKGHGGFFDKNIGDHGLAGAAAHRLTKQENSEIENYKFKEEAAPAQLYNLKNDPYQKQNLFSQYPEIVAEMKASLENSIHSQRTAPYQ